MSGSKVGEMIGKLRGGISQEELGEALGVSRETIKHWENGTRQIKAGDLVKLAKIFEVSTDYLLGLTEVASPENDLRACCAFTNLSETAVAALLKMGEHPDMGGDPDILYAVNILLEALEDSRNDNFDGYALVSIAQFLRYENTLSENDFSEEIRKKINLDSKDLVRLTGSAIEESIFEELKHSLRDIKARYYGDK